MNNPNNSTSPEEMQSSYNVQRQREQRPNKVWLISDQERNTLKLLEERKLRRRQQHHSKDNTNNDDNANNMMIPSCIHVTSNDDMAQPSSPIRRRDEKVSTRQEEEEHDELSQADLIRMSTLIPLGIKPDEKNDAGTTKNNNKDGEEDLNALWSQQKTSQSYFTKGSSTSAGIRRSSVDSKMEEEDISYFKSLLRLKQTGELNQEHLIQGTMRVLNLNQEKCGHQEDDLNKLWNENREVDQARLIMRSTGSEDDYLMVNSSPSLVAPALPSAHRRLSSRFSFHNLFRSSSW